MTRNQLRKLITNIIGNDISFKIITCNNKDADIEIVNNSPYKFDKDYKKYKKIINECKSKLRENKFELIHGEASQEYIISLRYPKKYRSKKTVTEFGEFPYVNDFKISNVFY